MRRFLIGIESVTLWVMIVCVCDDWWNRIIISGDGELAESSPHSSHPHLTNHHITSHRISSINHITSLSLQHHITSTIQFQWCKASKIDRYRTKHSILYTEINSTRFSQLNRSLSIDPLQPNQTNPFERLFLLPFLPIRSFSSPQQLQQQIHHSPFSQIHIHRASLQYILHNTIKIKE
jgi:hypothetical protein